MCRDSQWLSRKVNFWFEIYNIFCCYLNGFYDYMLNKGVNKSKSIANIWKQFENLGTNCASTLLETRPRKQEIIADFKKFG